MEYEEFYLVAERGDIDTVRRMLAANPGMVHESEEAGFTLAHQVAGLGRPEILRLLLQAGADPNAQTNAGYSPLHLADSPESVDVLVDAGADLNLVSSHGLTPLMSQATELGSAMACAQLLARGADINVETDAGTALSRALGMLERHPGQSTTDTVTVLQNAGAPKKPADLDEVIASAAAYAVERFAPLTDVVLDFSKASLEGIEESLDVLSGSVSTFKPEAVEEAVTLSLSYVLHVAQLEFGGRLGFYQARKQPVLIIGEPDFIVAVMPKDKCEGRLNGDTADNIPFFYEGIERYVTGASPGSQVTLV